MSQQKSYSDPEVQKLLELAGELPLALLAARYNKWAKANGHPHRTESGLRKFFQESGVDMEPNGEYVRTGTILECLQAEQSLIERWVRRGWIHPVQRYRETSAGIGPARRAFRRSDLVRMAREHPEAFAGCPRHGLFILLENEQLADQLRRLYPDKPLPAAQPVEVLCVETRRRYPSFAAAAREYGCRPEAIRNAVRRGYRAAGRYWQEIKPLNPFIR